jgi:hypothetical protein
MTAPNDLRTPDLPACASPRRAEVYSATCKALGSQAKCLLRQTTILPERHLQWSSSLTSRASHPPFGHPLPLKTHRL